MQEKYLDKKTEIAKLAKLSLEIRKSCLNMALSAGNIGSHIGGSLSCVEIFAVLYGSVMKYDVANPLCEERDRFVASKAHCILSNFAALQMVGFFDKSEINSFKDNEGLLAGHPYNPTIGLEFCGGSLGMGISVGVGMALTAKQRYQQHQVYVLLGDGELDEGSVWESFMTINKYKLDNITIIVDANGIQFDEHTDKVMPLGRLEEKLMAFGFDTYTVDGHNIEELLNVFTKERKAHMPRAIIARTVKCRGLKRLENKPESHHAAINEQDYEEAIKYAEEEYLDRIQ